MSEDNKIVSIDEYARNSRDPFAIYIEEDEVGFLTLSCTFPAWGIREIRIPDHNAKQLAERILKILNERSEKGGEKVI